MYLGWYIYPYHTQVVPWWVYTSLLHLPGYTPYIHRPSTLPVIAVPVCAVPGEGVLGSNLEIMMGMRRIEAS